jgi:hypothetical protein
MESGKLLQVIGVSALLAIAVAGSVVAYLEFTRVECTTVAILDEGRSLDAPNGNGTLSHRPLHTCFDRSGKLIEVQPLDLRPLSGGNFDPYELLSP